MTGVWGTFFFSQTPKSVFICSKNREQGLCGFIFALDPANHKKWGLGVKNFYIDPSSIFKCNISTNMIVVLFKRVSAFL